MTTQWVLAGGGSASATIAMSSITSSGCTATLTVPNGSTLVSWTLQYRKTPSTTWLNYATGITGTAQAVTGLDSSSTYEFRPVVTAVTTGGVVSVTTGELPARYIKQVNIIPAAYGNGMLTALGEAPAEGAISETTGRTYAGQLNVQSYNEPNARLTTVSAVRFLLLNQTPLPISGGKLIVGWSDDNPQIMGQGNSPTQVLNMPSVDGTTYNSVTGNARQGWKRAEIGGNNLLPVPAATADQVGAAWTDWITFDQLQLNLNRLYWRFFHPGQVNGKDYALTYAYYDPNPAYGSGTHGTVQGDALRYDDGWKYAGGTEWDYPTVLMFDNSNLVENPAAKTVSNAFVGRFSPSDWYIGEPMYVPPGPSVRPWIAAEFRGANV